MIQATNKESVRKAVSQFGPAPGARHMLEMERAAAIRALETGEYIVWRVPSATQDCTRVGPESRCFCGHTFAEHSARRRKMPCSCRCEDFKFVPQRPEEVGEWWLPRRKDFDIRTYQVKCKCGHKHGEHDPNTLACNACRMRCYRFESNFLCLVCDRHWEEHETLYETERERRAEGRTVGEAFMPLAQDRDIQQMVFERPPQNKFVRRRK